MRIMIKAIFQRKEQMVHIIYKIEQTNFTVLGSKNYCWNFIKKMDILVAYYRVI